MAKMMKTIPSLQSIRVPRFIGFDTLLPILDGCSVVSWKENGQTYIRADHIESICYFNIDSKILIISLISGQKIYTREDIDKVFNTLSQ